MPMIHLVLVGLKVPENIGFIARVAKNFGVRSIYLYNCNLTEVSFHTAAHAKDLLENAKIVNDLSFLSSMNLVVGTTGVEGGDYRFLRKPIVRPEKLRRFLNGEVAILFGREDFGLSREEIEMCHLLVKIPTSEEYPIMNVSHAAAVILYVLSKKKFKIEKKEEFATSMEIEVAVRNLKELLELIDFPKHRLQRTLIVFRRVLGRAKIRKDEMMTIYGIFNKTTSFVRKSLEEKKEKI